MNTVKAQINRCLGFAATMQFYVDVYPLRLKAARKFYSLRELKKFYGITKLTKTGKTGWAQGSRTTYEWPIYEAEISTDHIMPIDLIILENGK